MSENYTDFLPFEDMLARSKYEEKLLGYLEWKLEDLGIKDAQHMFSVGPGKLEIYYTTLVEFWCYCGISGILHESKNRGLFSQKQWLHIFWLNSQDLYPKLLISCSMISPLHQQDRTNQIGEIASNYYAVQPLSPINLYS